MVQVREFYNKNSKIDGIAISGSIADQGAYCFSVNYLFEITGFIHIKNYHRHIVFPAHRKGRGIHYFEPSVNHFFIRNLVEFYGA